MGVIAAVGLTLSGCATIGHKLEGKISEAAESAAQTSSNGYDNYLNGQGGSAGDVGGSADGYGLDAEPTEQLPLTAEKEEQMMRTDENYRRATLLEMYNSAGSDLVEPFSEAEFREAGAMTCDQLTDESVLLLMSAETGIAPDEITAVVDQLDARFSGHYAEGTYGGEYLGPSG